MRQSIVRIAPAALEDQRAESGLTTLSFQSASYPERHIWIDTDLAGELVIDLEDWNYQASWDNSVAHLEVTDENVPAIVQLWLTGATADDCIRLRKHRSPELK